MNRSAYFSKLSHKIREYYNDGVSFYLRKFQHALMLNPLHQIDDSYFAFVNYVFAITSALSRLQPLFANGKGCPLQVDFWIIPRHVVRAAETEIRAVDDEDDLFDYIEDFEEEEDEVIGDVWECPDSDDNDAQIGRIEQRLDAANVQYVKEVLTHRESRNTVANKMLNAIKCIAEGEYGHKRIVVIIDRRRSSRKLNKASDILYVFRPKRPYGELVRDAGRVTHETMQNLSLSLMLPKLKFEERMTHLSCVDDLKGRMFTLSFHIWSWQRIQCYHYMQTGCCTRFRKKYLTELWPTLFNDAGR